MYQKLEEFLLDCELRGLRNESIKCYRQKITHFLDRYEYTQEGINNFIVDYKQRNNSIASLNCYLRSLKAFSKFNNDGFTIRLLKEDLPVKDIYSEAEIKALIKKPVTKNFLEFRTWALINFLIGTGCRISTALEIRIEDIDLSSQHIILRQQKNHKQQYFPLSKALVNVLKQYLLIRGEEGYLFCNSYGDKADKRSVQKQVADYNRARGVNKTSCHLFRRTFAANYIMNGGNPFYLQNLLGHQTLDMTRYYVSIYNKNLGDNLEALSPLDKNVKIRIKM